MNLLNFLFPRRCLGCGKIGAYFCRACRKNLRFQDRFNCPVCGAPAMDGATHPKCKTRYTLDGLTSFFRYDGLVRQAIKTLKYRLVSDLADELISLIPESDIKLLSKLVITEPLSYILVPMPLHASRFRERGFNQAEVLGRLVAKRLGIGVRIDILKRIKRTTPQVEMKKKEDRLNNMKDVFAVNNVTIQQSDNLAIFLFDDVFTTGATMRAAAGALKRAGARFVWGVTIAR